MHHKSVRDSLGDLAMQTSVCLHYKTVRYGSNEYTGSREQHQRLPSIKPEETRRTQRLRVGLDASAATTRLTSSASLKPTVSHLLYPSPPFCASRPRKSLRLFYLLCHTPFRSAWPASLATASRCRPRLVLVWVVHSHASEVPSSPCLWWPTWRMTSRNSSSGLRHRSSYGVSYVRVCFANFRYPSWWTMAHTNEARTLPQVILESSLRAGLSA